MRKRGPARTPLLSGEVYIYGGVRRLSKKLSSVMTASPKISVVMAVHNGEQYLPEVIESVLSQDFQDFEFIILDDASIDRTADILVWFASRYSQIRLLHNPENQGLTRSLNIALREALGNYVARIDADDLCHADRLTRQFTFMEAHPEILISGSGYRIIDANGRSKGSVEIGLSNLQVSWLLGFTPPTFHPTFFFRRLLPDGTQVLYDEEYTTAQDYELWSRLSRKGKTTVIPDVTIDYRRHNQGISVKRKSEQALFAWRIAQRNLRDRLPDSLVDEMKPFTELLAYRGNARGSAIDEAVVSVRRLLNHDRAFFNQLEDRNWMRQVAAGLLADAVLARGGALKRPRDAIRFLFKAWDFLPLLAVIAFQRRATMRKALSRTFTNTDKKA